MLCGIGCCNTRSINLEPRLNVNYRLKVCLNTPRALIDPHDMWSQWHSLFIEMRPKYTDLGCNTLVYNEGDWVVWSVEKEVDFCGFRYFFSYLLFGFYLQKIPIFIFKFRKSCGSIVGPFIIYFVRYVVQLNYSAMHRIRDFYFLFFLYYAGHWSALKGSKNLKFFV